MNNYFLFIVQSALHDFSRNKGRTVLTSLGILIGVMAVVLLLAFGLGLRKYIQDQFESLGTNLLRVIPGNPLEGGISSAGGLANIRFDEKDVNRIKRVKAAEYIVPVFIQSVKASANSVTYATTLYASSAEIFPALNFTARSGRVFNKADVEKRTKIIVIGPKIAEKLYGDADSAIGKSISLAGQRYQVIGVTESKGGGGFGGPDMDALAFMPYKTAYSFNPDKKFLTIIVKAEDNSDLDTVKAEIKKVLIPRYKADDFSVLEQTEILNTINSIFGIINMVLVAIAAISLIVGGIGIMNIMYVTVTERIKEIGIRRAIGARKMDILSQFLCESVVLSLFGGLAGLGLSYLIVYFIKSVFPAYIDFQTVALALGVSSAIGIVFGVLPAKKAADLSPIDAIRYE